MQNRGTVIVVEGSHDAARIQKLFPDALTVITNGNQIEQATITMLKNLSLANDIVIFTDPDYPGEKIRRNLTAIFPQAKQAFIRKKDAISKSRRKVGVEHAADEVIIEALADLKIEQGSLSSLTINDLWELGLTGQNNSALLREKLACEFNLGCPNTKTLLQRLRFMAITKEELKEVCQRLETSILSDKSSMKTA